MKLTQQVKCRSNQLDVRDFVPMEDNVLIRQLDSHSGKIGSLIIPENYDPEDTPKKGEVIAVGPGKKLKGGYRCPTDLEVGEVVLYGRWSGNEIHFPGESKPYLCMKESDVIGVIDG